MTGFQHCQQQLAELRPEYHHRLLWFVVYCPGNCDLEEGTCCQVENSGLLNWHPGEYNRPRLTEAEAREAIRMTVERSEARHDPVFAEDFKLCPVGCLLQQLVDDQRELDRRRNGQPSFTIVGEGKGDDRTTSTDEQN